MAQEGQADDPEERLSKLLSDIDHLPTWKEIRSFLKEWQFVYTNANRKPLFNIFDQYPASVNLINNDIFGALPTTSRPPMLALQRSGWNLTPLKLELTCYPHPWQSRRLLYVLVEIHNTDPSRSFDSVWRMILDVVRDRSVRPCLWRGEVKPRDAEAILEWIKLRVEITARPSELLGLDEATRNQDGQALERPSELLGLDEAIWNQDGQA
ncbi:hypothetical protein F4821DRAFT_179408 [Hypoxylon rubiginosum]|uniref:Uncharacterized protein n=1 Tax=Hypoxylon rubiginosum TaxID=110542 RepID=A0ACC0CV13_9PEZI|nr:hypothetical protein F4821DRAFT_179408 [Hypoxylon rubiginosum]